MSWNFSLILFLLLVLTGLINMLDCAVLKKRRCALAQTTATDVWMHASSGGKKNKDWTRSEVLSATSHAPWWIEYSASFFPVLFFVFALRSFVVEPFRIPSSSMLPTLQSGDLILVNKFIYGIRLPIINKKILDVKMPKRGDVMVFRYPVDPTVDYIKRIVGLPGDEVAYINKKLYVNGTCVTLARERDYFDPDRLSYIAQYREKLDAVEHKILFDAENFQSFGFITEFPFLENCHYSRSGVRCKVPDGQYFAMGDNRDNSADSRYWGFIPDGNVVGKAFFIWMNFRELGRIGWFK